MRDSARVKAVGESIDLAGESFSPGGVFVPFRSGLIECASRREIERFISARDSLPTDFRGFLGHYSIEEYIVKGARLFLTLDAQGGFAVINGELASVFSLPGAHYGDMLVSRSIEEGARFLSFFDTLGKLSNLYGRHGFKETLRAPWDATLAPPLWNYERWGRPDYVEMSL